jgi:hypothetical protein
MRQFYQSEAFGTGEDIHSVSKILLSKVNRKVSDRSVEYTGNAGTAR